MKSQYTGGYTDNEVKLFCAVYGEQTAHKLMENISVPFVLYRMAMEEVFIENRSDAVVECIRKAVKALSRCAIYRHTEEFEQLITFK